MSKVYITNLKLMAIGKVYVTYTHNNPSRDTTLFMEKVVDILEELAEDVIIFAEALEAKANDQ